MSANRVLDLVLRPDLLCNRSQEPLRSRESCLLNSAECTCWNMRSAAGSNPGLTTAAGLPWACSGLDNAGKTTIVKRISGEDASTVSPTLGFNIKTLEFNGWARVQTDPPVLGG